MKIKKAMSMMLVLGMTVFTVACGNSSTTTSDATGGDAKAKEAVHLSFTHKLGETHLESNPEKVVVFDYGALDTLDKLGVEVTGVPQANLPSYLSKYKDSKYKDVGTVVEPDFEKIAEIDPDLILISGRQQAAYPELTKLAPTLFVGLDTTKYMDSFEENVTRLGQIFGKQEEVKTELANIEKAVQDVQAKTQGSDKKALIILANEGAVSAYGPGSRFGLIHDVLGVPAVDKTLKVDTHGQSISFEFIAEKNPDLLFVVDRGAVVQGSANTGAKALVENALVKKTQAFADNKIVYLDPNYWYLSGGGLVSVSEMIKEVQEAL